MKKQLISTHNQVYRGGDRRRKDFVEDTSSPPSPTSEAKKVTSAVVYFDNSSIPKYDLEEVENLHLPQELKNLIASRQAAKLRQESDEEKHLTFYHLWQDEWTKLNPPQKTLHGGILHQRLFLLENRPGIKNKLKQAVLRTSKPKTKGKQLTYSETY